MSQRHKNPRRSLLTGHWRFAVLAAALLAVTLLFTGFAAAKNTYLIDDADMIYTVEGYSDDVAEAFIRAGISLKEDDTYETAESDGFVRIHVIRTIVDSRTEYESIPRDTVRLPNSDLKLGTEQVVREGADGVRTIVKEITTVPAGNRWRALPA